MIKFEMSLSGFRKVRALAGAHGIWKEAVLSHLQSRHPSSQKKIIKFFYQKLIKLQDFYRETF